MENQTNNPHAASGWRIHCGVGVAELSTHKQHSLSSWEARVDQYMCKRSIIIWKNLGLSSPKETQSERDSCTSYLMHKTRSCARTLHKDRVRGVRDGAGKVRWEKLFKGWTTLNEIWRGAVGRRMGRKTTRGTHTRVS